MHKLLKWLQTSNVDNIVNSYENWSVRGGNTIIE